MNPTRKRQLLQKLETLAREYQWEQGYTPDLRVTWVMRNFALHVLSKDSGLLNELLHYSLDKKGNT